MKNRYFLDTLRLLVLLSILLSCASGFAQDAKPKRKLNPVFAKVEDDPALPRVLVIGDSISIGYTLAVRERLAGKANLHRIPTNSGHTGMGIAGLPKWLDAKNGQWDVIHFNFGLWDLCYRNPQSKNQGNRDKIDGTLTHTVEKYAENLEAIVTELEKTGAALIFATTTPVPEAEAGRKVGDDLVYNAAAIEVMQRHGIVVNDLNAAMAGKMEQYAKKPGDVHFTDEGSAQLADQVAVAIEAELPGSEDAGERVLFDGSSFEQWLLAEDSWAIDDEGAMTCLMEEFVHPKTGEKKQRGRGDIWSRQTYGDFELTVDYKLSEGANSGVFYRCNMNDPVQDGFEIQLMDNVGFQKTHGEKDARKLNGSFYDCLAPKADPQRPIGEWNKLTLRCEGPLISLEINGVETFAVDVNDWDTPLMNPDGTSNKFKIARKDAARAGRIGFQNHGQVVWFRNVKIRRL